MLAHLRFPVEHSRGRQYPEPEHPYRNAFDRDRDRVVHSRAFRRLEAKTQVFTPGLSDHFRNRLTHTIEVAQVARTVASVLGLDEDLTEALALVHDGTEDQHFAPAVRELSDFAAHHGLDLIAEIRMASAARTLFEHTSPPARVLSAATPASIHNSYQGWGIND